MIKGSVQQENITVVHMCAFDIRTPKHVKQEWVGLKGEVDSNTVMVEDVNNG